MVEGEATQEPTAPEGASASPPPEETSPAVEAEALAAPEDAPAAASGPLLDWGHVRGFQSVEAAPESLAARPDYAQELAKELNLRAARFARSVDDSIVLSSDGVLRWLGDPVARVVAGEHLLQPRAVLLADEALVGEERASVETRVSLWLAAHLRKVIGPLIALSEGTDLPEAARPVATKIAEALGVLEREGVRNDVRALDQTARGALRKVGVRFGSLYIYVPVLLKPGARALCSLLWNLRRGQETGADRLLAFAAAGRTSFANEGLLSPDSYRIAGFRLSGERVVRVDIIERLTDLIRAAIPDYMRSGSRPVSDAYGFVITPQMTSLTGCSGEAFASILRSLGFEPHQVSKAAYEAARPKAPTEPLKPTVTEASAEEAPATETAEGEAHEAEETQAEAVESPVTDEAAPVEAGAGEDAPGSDEPLSAEEAEEPAPTAEAAPAEEAVAEEPPLASESAAEPASAETTVASEPAPEEAAAVEAAAPAADEEIEIWRPAPRRPRAPRAQGAPEAREGRPHHEKGRRRHGHGQGRPPEAAAAAAVAPSEAGEARPQGPRPPRPERRDEGPRRFEGKGGPDNREDRRGPKPFGGPRRDQRPAQADPDSPFAKLAALKPLLERRDKRP